MKKGVKILYKDWRIQILKYKWIPVCEKAKKKRKKQSQNVETRPVEIFNSVYTEHCVCVLFALKLVTQYRGIHSSVIIRLRIEDFILEKRWYPVWLYPCFPLLL